MSKHTNTLPLIFVHDYPVIDLLHSYNHVVHGYPISEVATPPLGTHVISCYLLLAGSPSSTLHYC